jgi:hypothetical protein
MPKLLLSENREVRIFLRLLEQFGVDMSGIRAGLRFTNFSCHCYAFSHPS